MKIFALVFALALAGCAAASGGAAAPASDPLKAISDFTLADLQAADADAVAHRDAIAHACYPALEVFVKSFPSSLGTVKGAFSAFQSARDVGNGLQQGVPIYLRLGCSALVMDTQQLLVKLAAIGAGTAATAGAVLPIPVMPAPVP